MRYKTVRTDTDELKVSNLVIGSAVKMGALSEKEVFEIYDMFIDAGGNCIDTARSYADGEAEERVGRYLKTRPDREKILISSKGCAPHEDGRPRLSGKDMMEDVDASLKALGRDHIDIYWIHKDDESVPVEPIIDGVNDLLKSGKIRMIGCSNWHVERIAAANEYARKSGQAGFELSQIQWGLAATKEEYFKQFTSIVMDDHSYDWYYSNKMTIFSFSPQAQGFFSKAAAGGIESLNDMLRGAYVSDDNLVRLERVEKIAQERNVPVSVPVLAYLINNKLPCIPVFGATKKEMVKETLMASDFEMSPEEADALYNVKK